jgi:hypothetical protein
MTYIYVCSSRIENFVNRIIIFPHGCCDVAHTFFKLLDMGYVYTPPTHKQKRRESKGVNGRP